MQNILTQGKGVMTPMKKLSILVTEVMVTVQAGATNLIFKVTINIL